MAAEKLRIQGCTPAGPLVGDGRRPAPRGAAKVPRRLAPKASEGMWLGVLGSGKGASQGLPLVQPSRGSSQWEGQRRWLEGSEEQQRVGVSYARLQ